MGRISDVTGPETTDLRTRLAWAGERFADLADGTIDVDTGAYIWGMIIGWTDLNCTEEEKRQFNAIGGAFQTLIGSLKEL
jgi:hypothetical protein